MFTETLFKLLFQLNPQNHLNEEEKKIVCESIQFILEQSKKCPQGSKLAIDFSQTQIYKTTDGAEGGDSLLATAILTGNLDIVRLFIREGMNPNETTSYFILDKTQHSLSPLSIAASNGFSDITLFLLSAGAEIDKFDVNNPDSNALIVACEEGCYDTVQTLLLHNANTQFIAMTGKTAFQYISPTNPKLINLSLAHMALLDAAAKLEQDEPDILGASSALHHALALDANYVVLSMAKMAQAATARSLCGEYNENDYHPHLLKMAIKGIKTHIKSFPDFVDAHFSRGFTLLSIELNGYEINEDMDEEELLFKSIEEKNKTLRWFDKGTSFEDTKSKMKEGEYYADKLKKTKSPVYHYGMEKEECLNEELEESINGIRK